MLQRPTPSYFSGWRSWDCGLPYFNSRVRHSYCNCRWLPSSVNQLPGNASHQVGVGALVINDQGDVLVVREKNGEPTLCQGNTSGRVRLKNGICGGLRGGVYGNPDALYRGPCISPFGCFFRRILYSEYSSLHECRARPKLRGPGKVCVSRNFLLADPEAS